MSYIGRSSGDGERLVALARFPWTYDLHSWFAVLLPVAILIAIKAKGDALPDWVMLLGLALLAFGLFVFLTRMIRKWTTEIGVTTHRFVKKTGWFSLHTNEIALPNIEGVKVGQGFWGSIWGYGRLRIEGTGVDAVELPNIADPVGFRRAIETAKGIGLKPVE